MFKREMDLNLKLRRTLSACVAEVLSAHAQTAIQREKNPGEAILIPHSRSNKLQLRGKTLHMFVPR